MYSSVNNNDKSKSILSLTELIGIIAIFSFVLYLLFPKGNIEDFLETQGDNTNLSINYLQSMILYYPDNIELKIILMEKYTQIGERKKALELNHKLINRTSNKILLTQLYKVEYLLEKALYFKEANTQKLQALKEKLLAYYQYTKGDRDYLFFFGESTNIDYSYLKYHSLRHFLKENPEVVDYEFEKMAFDLATQLGYKNDAYDYLQKLIKYPKISDELSEYLIYSLFAHANFKKAKEITTQLFLESKTEDERTKYFHLTLYALVQDKSKSRTEISQLIQDYANSKQLRSADIMIILNTLLELGDSKEASNFAINMFYSNPESFNEIGVDLALKSLLYNTELEQARALSFFAESKFKKEKYLDKTILISSWLGESEAVSALNEKGYYKYKSLKYEEYFLKHENLDKDYALLGNIYKKKILQGKYTYFDNLAKYYDHTGEINKAENYFIKRLKQSHHKKALYYAIEFSHKNSHFKQGLVLYQEYKAKYGQNPKLHELSIKKLLVLKRFKEAYAMTKTLNSKSFLEKKQRFTDLAMINKDYKSLHKKLWDFEDKKILTATNFEHLIALEKGLNKSKKIDYLYFEAWKKTRNTYYLTSLMYTLLQTKKLAKFNAIKNKLNKDEKNILDKNIDFQILLAEYHVINANIPMALNAYDKVFKLAPKKISTQQSYLWFLLDNQKAHPRLKKKIIDYVKQLKNNPKLRQKVGISSILAAMITKRYKLADYWIKELIQKNPKTQEYRSLAKDINNIKLEKLYTHYDKMLNSEYLNTQLSQTRKQLGSQLKVDETALSYQWKFYQKIKSKLTITHYNYIRNKKHNRQTAFELAIKNSEEKFLWDFQLAHLNAKKNFISSSLNIDYKLHNTQINIDSKYQNKTTLTPSLEKNSLENSLALKLQTHLTKRTSFAFLAQKREFKTLNSIDLGTAEQMQISANYILRSGYPDISFNTYLSHNEFSPNIAKDFSEFGISSSFGTARQKTINTSWKPFTTATIAINDEQNLGTSLTFGISKTVKGKDSLDVLFNYYNGIGVISEPIYGLNIKYRF